MQASPLNFDVNLGGWVRHAHMKLTVCSTGLPSPSYPLLAGSSPSTWTDNAAIPTSLDQVVAPPVMDNIIGLFFDYVYPLTPALHRPSFMADLAARRDKSDPVFFALALVVLASTLVQVPRVLISLDKDEVEQLARRCVRVARAKTAFIWDDSVPMRVEFGESTPLREADGAVAIFYLYAETCCAES